MKCRICSEEAARNGYCQFHAKAYENLVRRYAQWKKALEISWQEYLSEIVKNPLAGEWVKDVAQHLMDSGEK